jgi:hypothetical protein
VLLNVVRNNTRQTSPEKNVLNDECGDSLWDNVLKQDENNLPPQSNKENKQPLYEKGKLKEKRQDALAFFALQYR